MRCPYCRTALTEHSLECHACRLTLDRASALLGPVPRVPTGVGDLEGLINRSNRKRLKRAITRLEWYFPQVRFHLLMHTFPTEHPFDLYVFWFFNASGLSAQHEKGGKNRTVLLAIDPTNCKASLMAGYGLEPFLDTDSLDRILDQVEALLTARNWTGAALGVIGALERLLENAAVAVAGGFGLSPFITQRPRDY